MTPSLRVTVLLVVLLVGPFATSPGIALAEPAASALLDDAGAYAEFGERQLALYREFDRRFSEARRAAPENVELAVAHCDFLERFADAEDIEWFETALADAEDCGQGLELAWSEHPVVRTRMLERDYSDAALENAERLWEAAEAWPDGLRGRVAASLRWSYEQEGLNDLAGEMAVIAVRLGQDWLTPNAIRHLLASGQTESARDLLLHELPPAEAKWKAEARLEAALELPDPDAARAELARYAEAEFAIDALLAARIALRAGDLDAATAHLADLDEADERTEYRTFRFDLAMARGEWRTAAAHIGHFDDEDSSIVLQRYAALIAKAPTLSLTWPLIAITIGTLLGLLAVAMAPGLLLAPAHYRGLVLRLRGRPQAPLFEAVGLRHAWIGLAILLLVPYLTIMIANPGEIAALLDETPDSPQLRLMDNLLGLSVGLLAALLAARGLGLRQWFGARHEVLGGLGAALLAWSLVLLVMAVNGLLLKLGAGTGADTSTDQTRAVQTLLENGLLHHGLWPTLLVVALLTPIYEELLFRGLLLGGLTRHIGFGWANFCQALAFTALHFDAPRIPFYFAVALLAGWLVRRRGTLWPAILLHVLVNALATFTVAAQLAD